MTPASAPAGGTRTRVGPRADLALVAGYHSPQLHVDVRLNANEAPEPPPAAWLEAVREALGATEFNRYPDRAASALREAIGALHGVAADHVYAANGSNEVLQALLLAYGGAGRAAAVFEPTYALHSHIARVTGTAVVTGERDDQLLIGDDELERVLGLGPAVTFLCSPNNPTGRLEPRTTVERALELAPGLLVVDEAYGQFAPWSAVELLDANPHLVVVRTFSKTWSLAGLRLGYALADPEVVEALLHVTLPYHLDAVKQAAGCAALAFDGEMVARVGRLTRERDRLSAALSGLGLEVVPSDANFILFRVGPGAATAERGATGEQGGGPAGTVNALALWRALVERSVLVRDVSGWPRLAEYLRVTVGTPAENDLFLAAVREALA